MDLISREISSGDKSIEFQFGKIARQADGAVYARMGDSIVLVTVAGSKEPMLGLDFFPLTVEVVDKMYAAGKIPGGFIKREGRPSEKSILTARLIDRPIRPLFPDGFRNEIQIIVSTLSVDMVNPSDILALNAASMALAISDIPVEKMVAAVRMGRLDGEWIINPTLQDSLLSDLDLIVAGSSDSIIMVEAGANEVDEELMIEALSRAHEAIRSMIASMEEIAKEIGKPKREIILAEPDSELKEKVISIATSRIREAMGGSDKLAREEAVSVAKKAIMEELLLEYPESEGEIKKLLYSAEKSVVRKMIVDEGIRPDGRTLGEIRPIDCEVAFLPRAHGSGLFTRGQTQVLSVLTLGTASEVQRLDGLDNKESKRYLHHYNFPPFSTGEVWRLGTPKRREVGHGALAERALLSVIPDEIDFPYTIRIVSEVLESNGSSSMASVCGSTLSLMDAGVPIKAPVAGIAMGLVKDGDKAAVLSDIQGVEDALGDMDFKVAGTTKGITALQMDMKATGVHIDVLKSALKQAKDGRLFILDKMLSAISEPRSSLSAYAPRIIAMSINPEKIGEVIGPGGKVIRGIIEATGATIDVKPDGTIYVSSLDGEGGEKAKEMIEALVKEVMPGEIYLGTVVKTTTFGAFVELLPGKDGLVHISKLAKKRIPTVEDVVNVGDKIKVKVVEIDEKGRINLTAIDVEEDK
ncbi:MAG: polyribonucleotide nucleotidyltransferase [Actinomycetota bacterium]|nr:polyribonucleotide nucleotidyltransferase [Actinomycetota bacterium]